MRVGPMELLATYVPNLMYLFEKGGHDCDHSSASLLSVIVKVVDTEIVMLELQPVDMEESKEY